MLADNDRSRCGRSCWKQRVEAVHEDYYLTRLSGPPPFTIDRRMVVFESDVPYVKIPTEAFCDDEPTSLHACSVGTNRGLYAM